MCIIKEWGLYEIDPKYLKFLYEVDSEVYYNVEYEKNLKPFIGIIIVNENYNYFIPLTSSKNKHIKWKLQSKEHFLIYEKIRKEKINENTIYKINNKNEIIHIISVLDIKKMIPVREDVFKKINFKNIENEYYRKTLEAEYKFCMKIQKNILEKANKIYKYQKETGKILKMYCNFIKLEEKMKKWREEEDKNYFKC